MSGSKAVAVKSAVITGLGTYLAGLADFNGTTAPERKVECSYAYDSNTKAAERLFATRAEGTTPPAALRSGRNHRDEAGFFNLVILVHYIGGSAEQAETRALAIGAQVEEWLADRKSGELGAGNQTLVVESWTLDGGPLISDNGYGSELTYRVRWTARLT